MIYKLKQFTEDLKENYRDTDLSTPYLGISWEPIRRKISQVF
ncbi:MAG: hypothetical protein K0S34_24 [Bacillales bacterium]|jgi:hypothetical protein|nr:hypothetical protein [Bacillales bacterium]